jgi:phytoene dehydrogenase-like protein
MTRDLDETAKALEQDGDRWTKTFANLAERFDDLVEDLFRPIQHVPAHPILFARFGLNAALPATAFVRRFRTDEAKALFAGVAAHAFQPLGRPLTSAVGLTMIAAGHHAGWPVAEGGSAAITAALAGKLAELGGRVECHTPVKTLPDADVVLLDVSPRAAAHIIGERLPSRTRRAYHRWRHGPAAYKVDLVVEGGIPWTNEACRRAGTLHLGGTIEEIARAERDIHYDRLPQRPFMLVGQQYLADPTRSNGSQYPIWAYAHVPNGYDGDATDVVLNQIERFAPGFKARIIAHTATRPHDLELYNPNYVGGDIATGANDPLQIALRPRMAIDPYATGVPGVYLCSAATPPGAGVHGMCGANAARSALRSLA